MMFFENHIYQSDLDKVISGMDSLQKLNNCKVLITGATGLIASVIVDIFRRYNQKGTNLDLYLTSRKLKKLVEMFGEEQPQLHFIETNLLDVNSIPSDIDYVIHTASVATPNLYKSMPVETVESNVISTLNLLNKYKDTNLKKFLFVSSGEVYGESNDSNILFSEEMIGKMDSLNPRSSYPISKLMSENLCVDFFSEYNIPTVIARPSHVYGPNYGTQDKRAASAFIDNAVNKRKIEILSSGMQNRSFTYVFDAAAGIIYALINGKNGEVYNVSNTREKMTMRKLASLTATAGNIEYSYGINDDNITHAVLNDEKLLRLGWRPCFSNKLGIEHSVEIRKSKI